MQVQVTQHEYQLLQDVLDQALGDLEARLYTTRPGEASELEHEDNELKALLHHIEAQHPMPAAESASLDGLVGPYRSW
jgi:hypothetical protein